MDIFQKDNQALLFDLDGTLIDTAQGFKALLHDLQWDIKDFDNMSHYYSGLNLQALLEHILIDTTNIENKLNEFIDAYYNHIEKYTFFYPGVIEGISLFTDNNIKWGVVSNKEHNQCVKICQQFNLNPNFLLGSGVIPFKKPHPAPLIKAAKKIKVKPYNCYYFGDMPTDMQASEHALMNGVYCHYGCYQYLDPCYTYSRVCHNFSDLYHVCNLETTNITRKIL